jgi:murein DD-endopeptidase MepM/ murein hydrolase activator NlpD
MGLNLGKTYSIIIVPGDHSGTRQYRVSQRLLLTSATLLFLMFSTVTVFVVTYSSTLARARRAADLEQENRELRDQVLTVNQLNAELEDLSSLRAQIVTMLGLDMEEGSVDFDLEGEADFSLAALDVDRLDHLRAAQMLQRISPTYWPVGGEVAREYFPPTEDRPGHEGLDIRTAEGAAVAAAGRGRVIETGHDDALGNYVVLDHGLGFRSLYGNGDQILVSADQVVDQGQIIAYLGSSDSGEGALLYFEIRLDGEAIDPRRILSPQPQR